MRSLYQTATLPAAALALIALAAVACNGGGEQEEVAPILAPAAGGVYLALGDSVADGSGASDPETTDYVALVAEALQPRFGGALAVQSLAVGGHTTETLIAEQLPLALDALKRGDVRLVTITIGGNDLSQYGAYEACLLDPADSACPLENGLLEVERRLDEILSALTSAGPGAAITIQLYPNLFSGTGHEFTRQAETAFGLLNGVIASVAARYDVLVADPRRDFAGAGARLTHLLDRTPDAHPNDEGYRVIADAFLEALGVERD